jgi:hypothetical protein
MSATFAFSESNTVLETVTDGISNLNFGSNDSPNLNTTTYPIIVNTSSFEKYIRAKFSGIFTTISNMKFWKSLGTYVAGETITAAANVAFATPSQTTNADSGIPTLVGSALAIQSTEIADPTLITTPGYTLYIRLQLNTTGSSPSGAVNQKTLTFQYDEV